MASVPDGPPVRFVWRRVTHHVAAAEGPERIAPEWWDAPPDGLFTCDHFRVEDTEGRRFWMVRRGLYGRETDRPQWFIQGLFA
jgi:protein ImuB